MTNQPLAAKGTRINTGQGLPLNKRNPRIRQSTVKKSVPSYLRVHRGDDSPREESSADVSPSDAFWNAFSNATGWRVDRMHRDHVRVLPAVGMDLMAGEPDEMLPLVMKESAAELAEFGAALTREIETLQGIIKRQEIELAASASASIASPDADQATTQVYETLQHALTATGFDSAAIYLLDEETEFLKARAIVGLPNDRLSAEPRPLRGSRADLEALVQDAVLMDDLRGPMGKTFDSPESAGAAICIALKKGDLPIGTLWLFSESPQPLDRSHVAIAKLVATQITLELSTASTARSLENAKESKSAVQEIAGWQYASLPAGNQLAPGWFADGMIESPMDWATGWHVWDVLPDGSLMFALGEAEESAAGGAMIAATARAALEAHGGYRHTPSQILQRISDTLWQANTTDQLFSLLYCRLDPETGEGQFAAAGHIHGLIGGPRGYRPLTIGNGRPLASAIDIDCVEGKFQLAVDESLLGYTAGLEADGIGQRLLGCSLKNASLDGENVLAKLRREIADFPLLNERGLASVSRSRT
ncbi:MAG: SpoIIE family protein phosphatase [Planctomycetota bacterium]